MKKIQIHHARAPFYGTLRLPGDKSISHRAALLSAIAEGTSTITGFLESEDCLATIAILRQLGIMIERPKAGVLVIHGSGGFFSKPITTLDCKNSGTTLRLLAGILAAQPFCSELMGDASLCKRPMKRIMEPLQAMGAALQATGAAQTPPLIIQGSTLLPICYHLPIPSAQVKSAILLAALFAHGETRIIEPIPCRDHTERMLASFQGSCSSFFNEHGARTLCLKGPQKLKACSLEIPGDISSAAFWIVAAAARQGSHLCLENVGINPTRKGFLEVLKRMGAHITITPHAIFQGEPIGNIAITGTLLKGTTIHGPEIPNVIDELPILAVAGALAQGTTIIKDAQELRVKETDRITALVNNLRAMGAVVEERADGLEIQGGTELHGTTLPSYNDHRIAMAFAIAGLFAKESTVIENSECIATSYPDFEKKLHSLALQE